MQKCQYRQLKSHNVYTTLPLANNNYSTINMVFIKEDLCLTELLGIVNICTKCLVNMQEVDIIIYLDFQNIFDKVPYGCLLT